MSRVREILEERQALLAAECSELALHEAQATAGRLGSVVSLAKVWRIAWIRGEHGFWSGWTVKEKGQVRQLISLIDPELACELVAVALLNWPEFKAMLREKEGWKLGSQATPSIGILLAKRTTAVNWLIERGEAAQTFASDDEDESWSRV